MIKSFMPIYDADCTILVLGSMPSAISLREQGYYAHPQNAFWRILYALWEVPIDASFIDRYTFLLQHHIALWDVLAQCDRVGSLDAAIRNEAPNNIDALLVKCPKVHSILCNGTAAYMLLRKHFPHISATKLPSTSPAAASLCYAQKLESWQILKDLAHT